MDIATTTCNGDTFSVLLGNGDGAFQPALSFTAGMTSQAIAAGDLNNDRFPDVIVTDQGSGTVRHDVHIREIPSIGSRQANVNRKPRY